MWERLKGEVRADYALFDEQVRIWTASYETGGGRIHCRRGCRNCCSLVVNATLTEALCVAEALAEKPVPGLTAHVERMLALSRGAAGLKGWLQGYRHSAGLCPFLGNDGTCSVYAQRPFSCRALLATRNPDWCGVDLSTLHPLEKQAFLSGLDRSAVAWPTHYAAVPQEEAFACESRASLRMAGAFGFPITGNLPFLVWLEREHRVSAALSQGGRAVMELLEEKGLMRPFLIGVGE